MKSLASTLALAMLASAPAQAQPAWRCGSEYTTDPSMAQRPYCKAIHPHRTPAGRLDLQSAASNHSQGSPRIPAIDTQQRDHDTRSILESELRSTLTRQAELMDEYKAGNGTPGDSRSARRSDELKAQMARNESDIAALRRELGRTPGAR